MDPAGVLPSFCTDIGDAFESDADGLEDEGSEDSLDSVREGGGAMVAPPIAAEELEWDAAAI